VSELRRLIVRHRDVAPMVSALLAGIDAAVTIRDADGEAVLQRGEPEPVIERHVVAVEGETLGWVDGGRTARGTCSPWRPRNRPRVPSRPPDPGRGSSAP
jgi:hypothetical protein